MQIAFTGLKNIGYEVRKYDNTDDFNTGDVGFIENEEEHFINIQLTDDFNGKDLTEFKNRIKTTNLNNYINPLNPDFLSISISKDVVKDNFGKDIDYEIYINDADKELKVEDKNLPMISYIAKLLNRIAAMKNKEFVVNNSYLESDDAASSIIIGENLKETYEDNYDEIIENIHSTQVVKKGAKQMENIIQEIMVDYFA